MDLGDPIIEHEIQPSETPVPKEVPVETPAPAEEPVEVPA